MNIENQDEIVSFFREVQRVISKHGLEKVLKQLRQIHFQNGDAYEQDVFEYILIITSNEYEIEKDEVLHSNKRGKVAEARRMCFALMKEHLNISDEEIGDYFGGKSRQFVNKELKALPLNQDKFTNRDEKRFVKDFISLTTDVLFFKNSYDKTKKYE